MAVHVSSSLTISEETDLGVNSPIIGWQNLVTTLNVTADTEASGFPATNLANPNTASKWTANDTSEQYITFDITGSNEIDYVGIARHNLGTGLVTVSLETQAAGGSEPWIEVVSEFIPADDRPIVMRFTAEYAQYARIRLQPVSLAPSMAVVYVGKLLVMERGLQPGYTPFPYAVDDDVIRGASQSGDYLGSITLRKTLSNSASFTYLSADWFRDNCLEFIESARDDPFFFAWAPDEYPTEVGYCWTENSVRPDFMDPLERVTLDMTMKAISI